MESIITYPMMGGKRDETLKLSPQPTRAFFVRTGFVGLYIAVLAWFGVVDVYHNHFFADGPVYLGYSLARVLFLLYLGWTQFWIGRRILFWWQRRGAELRLTLLDEFLACFFAGGAVLAAFVFLLGFFNLFYYWLFALGSAGLVCWSAREVRPMLSRWSSALAAMLLRDRRIIRCLAKWLALGCLVMIAGTLLLVKGLYPGGGHDYYTHYFPYYRHVLLSHGLWPNDVWYHFYVSKGATIKIAAVLLTDMQAPETITYLYFLVASLAVYSLLRRWTNNVIVPCLGTITCLAALLWTDQWGHFQKHHEFSASLIMSVAWLIAAGMSGTGATLKAWVTLLALAIFHCVMHAPTMTPLLCAGLAPTLALALLRRQWNVAATALAGLGCAMLTLMCLLLLNYLITGLAEVTPLRTFWKFADQERFSHWVSPYMMTLLLEANRPDACAIGLTNCGMPRTQYLLMIARTDAVKHFFPALGGSQLYLSLAVVLILAARLATKRTVRFSTWGLASPVMGVFAGALLLSQIASQPISTWRSFSFMVFLVVLIALGVWTAFFRVFSVRRLTMVTSILLPAGLIVLVTVRGIQTVPKDELRAARRFAVGKQSLSEAFRARGVTNPIANAVRQVIGHEPRIYSFDVTYSMAPDCELESFISFALHEDYHEILFGPPQDARAALQKQKLDYFLIDLSNKSSRRFDVLQYAPLFRIGNIEKNFALRWQQGDVYLLTWPGPDATPLPPSFLARYAGSGREGPVNLLPLYTQLRTIYENNQCRRYPVYRDPSMPTVRTWQ